MERFKSERRKVAAYLRTVHASRRTKNDDGSFKTRVYLLTKGDFELRAQPRTRNSTDNEAWDSLDPDRQFLVQLYRTLLAISDEERDQPHVERDFDKEPQLQTRAHMDEWKRLNKEQASESAKTILAVLAKDQGIFEPEYLVADVQPVLTDEYSDAVQESLFELAPHILLDKEEEETLGFIAPGRDSTQLVTNYLLWQQMTDIWLQWTKKGVRVQQGTIGRLGSQRGYAEGNYITGEQMAFINDFLLNHPGVKFEDYIYTCMEQNLQTAFLNELENIWLEEGAYTWKQTDYGGRHHMKWDDPIYEAYHTGTGTTTLRDQYYDGDTLKEYISTMVHIARKALPQLKGTPDDPLLNTTHFGPNKRYFQAHGRSESLVV